jgi:hypothetical protein
MGADKLREKVLEAKGWTVRTKAPRRETPFPFGFSVWFFFPAGILPQRRKKKKEKGPP